MFTVYLKSFSYREGYPEPDTGLVDDDYSYGFVFDCRGILNPGRIEEFKYLTGCDCEVATFLSEKTKMLEYLQNIKSIVDMTIENYISRGIHRISIAFGCTGGQHRSVYAVHHLAEYLENKNCNMEKEIIIEHCNKDNWVVKKDVDVDDDVDFDNTSSDTDNSSDNNASNNSSSDSSLKDVIERFC